MLGNTANGLFWTYRLLERAENMSRLIETGQRIALTRLNSSDKQWLYVMQTAAVSAEYKKYYKKGKDKLIRNYGLGAQILKNLKVKKMILVTKSRKKVIGLEGYNLSIVKQEII